MASRAYIFVVEQLQKIIKGLRDFRTRIQELFLMSRYIPYKLFSGGEPWDIAAMSQTANGRLLNRFSAVKTGENIYESTVNGIF
jgi:hypothetical protein